MARDTASRHPRSPVQPAPHATQPPPDAGALHDLANLVDAAARCAAAARRSCSEVDGGPLGALEALEAALAQITDLVASLGSRGDPRAGLRSSPSIADAITHGAELLRATAAEQGVRIDARVHARLDQVAAPGFLRVVADALRNALESIALARCAGGAVPGRVIIDASPVPARSGDEPGSVLICIEDDGVGPAADLPDPFVAGATSKPGSSGLGLAVARQIVQRLHGTIVLRPGSGRAPGRPGAVLLISLPLDSLRPLAPLPSGRGRGEGSG